jgi:RNA polymerase sigma-70 factor (ECF subfamily)
MRRPPGFERQWQNRCVARAAASRPERSGRRRDDELLDGLRRGDDALFAELVERWSGAMLRLALARVDSRAVAEEVVQDAWLTVLHGLERFERRSAFRTWVFGIVINLARSRARSERRSVPLPSGAADSALDAARFRPPGERWSGHWDVPPRPWPTPEDEVLAAERREVLLRAVAELPPAQREVLVLRDLEGCPAAETCNILGLTDTNQRVLLHRARSRVRSALEHFYDHEEQA